MERERERVNSKKKKKDWFSQKKGRPPANRRERWVSRILVALCFTTEIVAAAVALADYMPTLTELWAESEKEKEREKERKRELNCPTERPSPLVSLFLSSLFWPHFELAYRANVLFWCSDPHSFLWHLSCICVRACTHRCFTVFRLERDAKPRLHAKNIAEGILEDADIKDKSSATKKLFFCYVNFHVILNKTGWSLEKKIIILSNHNYLSNWKCD